MTVLLTTQRALLTAALMGSALPLSAWAQDRSTEIYGRIDLSVDSVDAGKNSNVGYGSAGNRVTRMTDNTSRLGFRGAEALPGGMQALWGLEYGFNADDGSFVSPPMRYAFVGLKGGWGVFNLGRLDSSVPTGSPIYSQAARAVRWIVHDAGATAIGTRVLNGSNRVSNAMTYRSPSIANFEFSSRLVFAGPDAPSTTNPSLRGEGDLRQYQFAVDYVAAALRLGIGHGFDDKRGGFVNNDFKNKWQAVASYDFGVIRPYALYGRDKYQNTATTRAAVNYWLVGATAPLGGNFRTTLNYMARDVQTDRAGVLKKIQGDISYSLSKRSTIYLYADRDTTNSNRADSRATAIGLGMLHQF